MDHGPGGRDVEPSEVGVLIIPGGQGPDKMRLDAGFVELVRRCMAGTTYVAAICHGSQLLIEAGAVSGRRMTS